MNYLINLFFIGSIFGYFFEESLMALFHNPYNSGILTGPWTPIYGFAVIIILAVGKTTDKLKIKKYGKIILFLLGNLVFLGILEFLGGYLIEKVLGIVYWNYLNFPLHIGKYVCLYSSIIWLLLSLIFYYIVLPKLSIIKNRIPKVVNILLFYLLIIDILYTSYEFLLYK